MEIYVEETPEGWRVRHQETGRYHAVGSAVFEGRVLYVVVPGGPPLEMQHHRANYVAAALNSYHRKMQAGEAPRDVPVSKPPDENHPPPPETWTTASDGPKERYRLRYRLERDLVAGAFATTGVESSAWHLDVRIKDVRLSEVWTAINRAWTSGGGNITADRVLDHLENGRKLFAGADLYVRGLAWHGQQAGALRRARHAFADLAETSPSPLSGPQAMQ